MADICHFLIYRHRPISVFSSADLNSGTSAGSPVLLVRWKVLLPHVKDPKPKLLEDSTTVLGDKGSQRISLCKWGGEGGSSHKHCSVIEGYVTPPRSQTAPCSERQLSWSSTERWMTFVRKHGLMQTIARFPSNSFAFRDVNIWSFPWSIVV